MIALKGKSSYYAQQSCPPPKICHSWMSTVLDVALISFRASPSASLVWVKEIFFFFRDGDLRGSCWFQSVLGLYPVIWSSMQSLVSFYLRNILPCSGALQKAQISTKKIPTNDSSYSWSGRNPSTCKDTLLCTVSLWDGLCETTKMHLRRRKLHLRYEDY